MTTFNDAIENAVKYAEVIDDYSNDNYVYFCEAAVGTALATPKWRIQRMEVATNIFDWADGNADFDNAADAPNTLTYS